MALSSTSPVIPQEFERMSYEDLEDESSRLLNNFLDDIVEKLLDELKKFNRGRKVHKSFTEYNLASVIASVISEKSVEGLFKSVIGAIVGNGVESVEKELDVNIAMDKSFREYVSENAFSKVKDLSGDLREDLQKSLLVGWQKGEGMYELKNRILDIVGEDSMSRARAETIARTESISAFNFSRLESAKKSGVELLKSWDAYHDSKTGSDSISLEKRYRKGIGLSEEFFDEVNNKYVLHPPNRPNCRCRLKFIVV